MRPKGATPQLDRVISTIAERQHGIVSLAQLGAAGVTPRAVGRRVQSGRLHRIHRGVYAVGHPRLSREGRWLAAVLACGEAAVLSHRSAGALWELRPRLGGAIEVTMPGSAGRKRCGLTVHRSSTLLPAHVTRRYLRT